MGLTALLFYLVDAQHKFEKVTILVYEHVDILWTLSRDQNKMMILA